VEKYKNLSGNSGILAFELSPDSITIQFEDGKTYLYNNDHPGADAVKKMKLLAQKGKGLATFINQEVKGNFARKLR
jgi:hypothetical protein